MFHDSETVTVRLPYDVMMARFLPPIAGEPDLAHFVNVFDNVSTDVPSDMCNPLMDALNTYAIGNDSRFRVAVCAADPSANPAAKTIMLAMYPTSSATGVERREDSSEVELSIHCHTGNEPGKLSETVPTGGLQECSDAQDPPSCTSPETTDPQEVLNHVAMFLENVFQRQQRIHFNTVIVFGGDASIARWDRSSCIVSETFNYKAEPAKLALFVWRLSHATAPDVRGHDLSATRVLPDTAERQLMLDRARVASDSVVVSAAPSDHARALFAESLDITWPWWKLTVPYADPRKPPREYLVAKPTFAAPGVVGRGTRGYVALDYTDPEHPLVYLKDCWRAVNHRRETEGSILTRLNRKGVRNVPTVLCHGDVGGVEVGVARDIWSEVHSDGKERCPIKEHRHYRLVVAEVGKPLQDFSNGRELVWVIANALFAHDDAYTKAHTIHCDISVGNILIMPDPSDKTFGCYGILTDWELSQRTDGQDPDVRHLDQAGTWQFQSVNVLNRRTGEIDIPDELESFFHVLLYCAIRYLPHDCPDVARFIHKYFDDSEPVDETRTRYTSGLLKATVLLTGKLATSTRSLIHFLQAPLPHSRVAGSSSAVSSGDPWPLRTDVPAPPLPDTAGPLSKSAPHCLPAPDSEDALANRHPIDFVLRELLDHFSALYQLRERALRLSAKNAALRPKQKASPEMPSSLASSPIMRRFLAKASKPDSSKLNREAAELRDLEMKADVVRTHAGVGRILAEAVADADGWPDADKTGDQLQTYLDMSVVGMTDQNQPGRPEKRGRPHDGAPEGTLDGVRSSKRPRSLAASRI